VRVPGSDEPVEVGHGVHDFVAADTWSSNGRLAAGATVRDVLDHEPSWRRVIAAASELGFVDGEAEAAQRLKRWLDAPAPALADALPPPTLVHGGETLRERLADLWQPPGGRSA
jgi:alpha-L-rhamnosidase